MKYLLLMSILVFSACTKEGDDFTGKFTSVCVDNVQYWIKGTGSKMVVSPRIDPETLTFVNCK